MEDFAPLRQLILDDVARLTPLAVKAAASLCEQLPSPGSVHDELAADCHFRTAFAAEQLKQYTLGELLYTKALAYPNRNRELVGNIHYHLGVCLEAQAKLTMAIQHYRLAVENAREWPLVRQLARFHAAHLLMLTGENALAAGEFGVLCEEDRCADLSDVEVRLRRLFCIIRSGDFAREDLADPVIDSLERLPDNVVTVLPQLAMDLASAAEEHSCHALAERLYRILIASIEIPPHFQANAWFRLGLVTDLQAQWSETEDCYRRALQHPGAWPELRDLARFHLANFLMAAESYQGAAHLFAEHADQASNYILPLPALQFREAICRFRAGDVGTAECILQKIRGTPGNETISPSVERLLAEIFESRKDFKAAVLCYEKLIQHPCAEMSVKMAALQRLHSIQG